MGQTNLSLFQVPFLFGVSALEKLASWVIHLIFRRTGRHLFLNDDDEGKPPLLKRMMEDNGDCYFMYVTCIHFLLSKSVIITMFYEMCHSVDLNG